MNARKIKTVNQNQIEKVNASRHADKFQTKKCESSRTMVEQMKDIIVRIVRKRMVGVSIVERPRFCCADQVIQVQFTAQTQEFI